MPLSTRFSGPKGMNDILPGEVEIWQHIEACAREVFSAYGYLEARTPMVEDTALFVRSVGEATDIVGKEMYTFEDKGGRSLSLRPEGTAPAARAYIEHAVSQKEPVTRWFYMGPMFRYERMKTGRYRQFSQIGAEAYGAAQPAQDVEMMEMVVHLLSRLGLSGVSLQLNSLGDDACRPAYQEKLLKHLGAHREKLCGDCQSRLERNPLRVLDCKNEACGEIARQVPSSIESLCAECRTHFDEVQRQLSLLGVPYRINPLMVRGLDYYTRTAFEFIAEHPVLGTASAVGGGGRYDKLVKALGGPDSPAVGFALGLDRLVLLLKESQASFLRPPDVCLVSVDAQAFDQVLRLAQRLRHAGLHAEFDARGGSVKSQMKRADKSGARFALVLGENELATQTAELKPLSGGEPRKVALGELEHVLRQKG